MKKKSLSVLVATGIIAITITVLSCKKSDDDNNNNTPALTVKLATDDAHGKYLVDKDGYALYFFSNDFNGRNFCAGGCKAIWPYFYAGAITQDSIGEGLNIADFDTIMVAGEPQTRYKGWPLYYYAPGGAELEPSGQVTGESITNWLVAKPDYTIMLTNAQLVGNDGKNYLGTYVEGNGKTVYFTDAKGVTLYTFAPDSFNINKYTKEDFSNNGTWPIYDTTSIVVPSTLDKTLFTTITVFGKKQLTYKGWPLYYFGSDQMIRGNNKGVSVPVPGKWPVGVKDMAEAPKKQSLNGTGNGGY
jgi:predicted lipoprotein with Yx(FWY)xxD motif